jgi:hypothetical protein
MESCGSVPPLAGGTAGQPRSNSRKKACIKKRLFSPTDLKYGLKYGYASRQLSSVTIVSIQRALTEIAPRVCAAARHHRDTSASRVVNVGSRMASHSGCPRTKEYTKADKRLRPNLRPPLGAKLNVGEYAETKSSLPVRPHPERLSRLPLGAQRILSGFHYYSRIVGYLG